MRLSKQQRDFEYLELAKTESHGSRCISRQLGCILVLRNGMTISGTNGPPLPLKKCKTCLKTDHGYEYAWQCKAVHAERQTLLKCARRGYSTIHSTLYAVMGMPCKDCLLELIAAGVARIVVTQATVYDPLSQEIMDEWVSSGGIFDIIDIGHNDTHIDFRKGEQ